MSHPVLHAIHEEGNPDSYERQLERLLNWELTQFTDGNVSRIPASTSPVKTPYGSSKRPKSRSAEPSLLSTTSGPLPPRTATLATGTRPSVSEAKRHATRRTKIFDRHLRHDLIIRRTTVLPGLTHALATLCEDLLEANPTQPWSPRHEFADTSRAQLHDEKDASHFFSREGVVKSVYEYRQNAAVYLFSTVVSADGIWPVTAGRGRGILHFYPETDPDQTKALPDACLYVDDHYLSSADNNARPSLADGLKQVVEQDFSPLAAWEFKDITCATLRVMLAIRELCNSPDVYQWISCSGLKSTERCPRNGCVDQTGKWRVSGRCAKFDSKIMEDFLCWAAGRTDIAFADYPDSIKPSPADLQTARWIIQQLWAELVVIEGTVGVVNGGNYEMLFIRHRATQSLFTSDIIYTPNNRVDPNQPSTGDIHNPSHMRLHTGLLSLITVDGIQRAKLSKAAKGIDERLLPPRMRHPEEFNLSAWREGFHIDTKKNTKRGDQSKPKVHAWNQGNIKLRRKLMTCRRVRLRLRGNTASHYSQFDLEQPGNVLHLQNKVYDLQKGPNTFLSISPDDNAIVILPHNNRGTHTNTFTCNLGCGLDSDDYYHDATFIGIVASNADDVERLTHQHWVHGELENRGNIQKQLGLFINQDRRFGILFLECINRDSYWPLSDSVLMHNGIDTTTIEKIEAYFNRSSFAHRSLSRANIFVRRNDGADAQSQDALFYITEWQHAKIWGAELSTKEREEKDLERANDKKMLKTILDAYRR